MVSEHVADMVRQAVGKTSKETLNTSLTFPKTEYDVNEHNDTEGAANLNEDQCLQNSVRILKAVACIMSKLYYSEAQPTKTPTSKGTDLKIASGLAQVARLLHDGMED